MRRKRFSWLIGLALVFAIAMTVLFAKPLYFFIRSWWRDQPGAKGLPPGYVDDASRMNRTHVAEVWQIPANPDAAESQLRDLIKLARSKRLRVAIAGARHSMGGHTIYPEGITLDMPPFNRMELNAETQTLRMTSYPSGTFEVKLGPQDDKPEDALEAYYPTPTPQPPLNA